jgi:hypothetical protein
LINPNTYGLPVAFFAAGNENEPDPVDADVVVEDAALELVADDPLPALLELLELLEPQPAARSAEATTAAAVPSHLEPVIYFSSWLWCE